MKTFKELSQELDELYIKPPERPIRHRGDPKPLSTKEKEALEKINVRSRLIMCEEDMNEEDPLQKLRDRLKKLRDGGGRRPLGPHDVPHFPPHFDPQPRIPRPGDYRDILDPRRFIISKK